MATITLTIPDPVLNRVVNAVAANYGYQSTVPNPSIPGQFISNPETKTQFAKRQLNIFLKENVKSYEVNLAIDASRQSTLTSVETEIQLS